jgi:hypothetical protein
MTHQQATQAALYSALTADAPLMAIVQGVFDGPDQNQAMPYITLGENTATPDDLIIETGGQLTFTVQFWDKAQSFSRLKQIMDRAVLVLHRKTLMIAGTQAVECVLEFAETFKDSDAETRRGVCRFRILTFDTA